MPGTHDILGLSVAVTSLDRAAQQVVAQAKAGEPGYVCAANVHMVMEAYDDPAFRDVVNSAVLTVPDGKPLSWWMRLAKRREAQQVRGPDLFLKVCELAEREGIPVGLYGGTQEALDGLVSNLHRMYPRLVVALAVSPPFRRLGHDEDLAYARQINASGARVLFVGLGCPKQENWMFDHQGTVDPIMIGVGAAFDFYSGAKKRAPEWMIKLGLEWLHRLWSEPRRLWKRYLVHNPRFLYRMFLSVLKA